MLKSKKILSFVSSFVLIIAFIVSIGNVTAFADLLDRDVQGHHINSIIDDYILAWRDDWEIDRQCPNNQDTLVFIDSQLLEFNFMERLCNSFDGVHYNTEGLQYIYFLEGIRFFVHSSGDTYVDVTEYAFTGNSASCVYDFSDTATYDELSSFVGEYSMCALAIWHFELCMQDFFGGLQYEWLDDFFIYVIERDPIPQSQNGLNLKIFYSATGEFGSQSGGAGA